MATKKRIFAMAFSVICCIALLFSIFFMASEAGHECSGDNCEICCVLHICENLLKSFAIKTPIAAFAFLLICLIVLPWRSTKLCHVFWTLVSLKMKLSN